MSAWDPPPASRPRVAPWAAPWWVAARPSARATALLGGCLLACVLGIWSVRIASAGGAVASWWPAAGVCTAVLLLGCRWSLALPALVVATAVANAVSGRDPVLSACFGLVNAAEAAVLALVLTGGRRRPARLDDLLDAARLALGALAGALLLGVGAGLAAQVLGEGSFGETFRSGVPSHASANLVVLPAFLLLALRTPAQRRSVPSSSRVESLAQVGTVAVTVGVLFRPGQDAPLGFALFPLLVWGCLRLAPWVMSLEVLALAATVTLLTDQGAGPFAGLLEAGRSPAAVAALVQAYLVATALVVVPTALVSDQRRRSLAAAETASTLTDAVLDSEDALVVVLDRDLRVVRVNAAASRFVERPEHDLLHSPVWRWGLLGPDERSTRDFLSRAAVEDDEREVLWRSSGDSRRSVLWSAREVALPHSPVAWVLTGIEVTGHRYFEGFLRRVLDATTGTLVVGTDPSGRITFWNSGAGRLLGRSESDMIGSPVIELVTPDGTPWLRRVGSEGSPPPGLPFPSAGAVALREDWTCRHADGTTRVLAVTTDAMRSGDGAVVLGWVAVGKDVTSRRRAEEQMAAALRRERESVERLAEVGRIRSQFVASVSHELRTPLTSVLGYTYLLDSGEDPLTDHQRGLLARVERNGQQLLELIEDLLELSRIESGAARRERRVLDLSALVADVTAALRDGGLARAITWHVVEPAAPVHVLGAEAELRRAVSNVIGNAVKFSVDGGRIIVETRVEGGQAVASVRDTGIGMTPEEVRRAFEPFYRGPTATEAGVPGTGLGLGIVASVVSSHGGTVRCESSPGLGSTVTVVLPLAAARGSGSVVGRRAGRAEGPGDDVHQ
jgi:PAS domain S-box-containing protein